MKVVTNAGYGGFSFSPELAAELGLQSVYETQDDYRTNPVVVAAVERDSKTASGAYAELVVCEIPDGSYYRIDEYDGYETLLWSATPIHEAGPE